VIDDDAFEEGVVEHLVNLNKSQYTSIGICAINRQYKLVRGYVDFNC
jgi:hypothetical protein